MYIYTVQFKNRVGFGYLEWGRKDGFEGFLGFTVHCSLWQFIPCCQCGGKEGGFEHL